MHPSRPLDPWDQYQIDDCGLIRPVHTMGWTKERWKNAESPEAALVEIALAPVVMEGIFQPSYWQGLTPDEWKEMRAKRYLDIEDGFYLATGVNVGYGTFRFDWRDDVFFNMRPDFGYLSLISDLGAAPINLVESAVRDRLVDYFMELDALMRAIAVGEIKLPVLYTIDWWLDFWKIRGIAVSGATGPEENTESKVERQKRIAARLQEEKTKGNKAFLGTVAKEEGVSVTRIKQLRTPADESAVPGGVWTGLLPVTKAASSKKGKTKD